MRSPALSSVISLWHEAWVGISCHRMVPPDCRATQDRLVQARVRTLSVVITVLMLAWIPIDAFGLDRAEFVHILPLRLALAMALLGLAQHVARLSSNAAVRLFVWLQALAFVAMELGLEPAHGNFLRAGYGLFPFVVTAQLAIFPLPWGCSLRVGLAALVVLFVPALIGARPLDPPCSMHCGYSPCSPCSRHGPGTCN